MDRGGTSDPFVEVRFLLVELMTLISTENGINGIYRISTENDGLFITENDGFYGGCSTQNDVKVFLLNIRSTQH